MDISNEDMLIFEKYIRKILIDLMDISLNGLDFAIRFLKPTSIIKKFDDFDDGKNEEYKRCIELVINSKSSDLESVEQICKIILGGRDFDKNNPSNLNFNDNICESIDDISIEDVETFYENREDAILNEIPSLKSIDRKNILNFILDRCLNSNLYQFKYFVYSKILDNAVDMYDKPTTLNKYVDCKDLVEIAKENDYKIIMTSYDYNIYLNNNNKFLIIPNHGIQELIYKKILSEVQKI